MNNKQLSLLGLCRKAGKLSMGHDSSIAAISTRRAKVCILCEDVSDRQKTEMTRATSYDDRNIPLVFLDCKMEDIKTAIGRQAGVLTINDEGFANSFLKITDNNTGRNNIHDQ